VSFAVSYRNQRPDPSHNHNPRKGFWTAKQVRPGTRLSVPYERIYAAEAGVGQVTYGWRRRQKLPLLHGCIGTKNQLASDVERRMAGLQGSNASYVADMVSCAKTAATASGTKRMETRRDHWWGSWTTGREHRTPEVGTWHVQTTGKHQLSIIWHGFTGNMTHLGVCE
jgi:hypothetical protein